MACFWPPESKDRYFSQIFLPAATNYAYARLNCLRIFSNWPRTEPS